MLRSSGHLLFSIEPEDDPGEVRDWLGVPMFFSQYDAAQTPALVREAGFESSGTRSNHNSRGQREVEYLWVLGAEGRGLAPAGAMRTGDWPGGIDVRLRIALHRGRPALTDTGYVGLSVHAAARICFAAHGGQIVMSSAVRAATTEPLPDRVSVSSLGAWRFRGLPEPVTPFQVNAPDLLSDFPPLRSAIPAE